MMISLIAAMAKNRVIGQKNIMPWHLPADLKHFKAVTLNKPVIMGRKTYESIGRPLPNRRNIVVTRQVDLELSGCDVVNSLDAAFALVAEVDEVMVMGGANIYAQCMEQADRMVLTFIDVEVKGDAFFPEWRDDEWKEVSREHHQADENNPHDYTFVVFERIK